MKTLVIAEHILGKLKKNTLSAISFAAGMGECSILVMGEGISHLVKELSCLGAEKVFVVDSEPFKNYLAHEYSCAISDIAQSVGSELVTMASSSLSNELLPIVATKLEVGMVSGVTGYANGCFRRSMYSAQVIGHFTIHTKFKIVTISATAFSHAQPKEFDSEICAMESEVSKGERSFWSPAQKMSINARNLPKPILLSSEAVGINMKMASFCLKHLRMN